MGAVVLGTFIAIVAGTRTNAFCPNAFEEADQDAPFVVETTLYDDIAAQAVPATSPGLSVLLDASLIGVALGPRRRVRG